MAEIAFKDDFNGEIEIAILTALLHDSIKPLTLCREAPEPETRLEFRQSAIAKLGEVDQRLQKLISKLKAGI